MKKKFLLIPILLLASSCRPVGIMALNPAGPAEYKLGWEDGCDSGMSAIGGYDYKLVYGFKKRAEMAANDQYKQGWNEGFTQCRFILANANSRGDWEAIGLGEGF